MRLTDSSAVIKHFFTSWVIFFLFALKGLNAETCQLGCPNADSGILQYEPGSIYEYSIDTLMNIGISKNDVDDTTLKINGQAKLYFEGNCVYSLQLDRITVSAVKGGSDKQILQGLNKPVKFTLVGGELQSSICADPSDSIASLNIKRGIISLLQVSDKPYETDVFGVCPTLTTVAKAGSSEMITKVRNLNSCAHREQIANGLFNGVINEKAGVKSSAVLKSDYSKELKLVKGILENVQLVEEYKFAAVTTGATTARAQVKTILRLGKVSKGNAPQISGVSSTIIFEQTFAPTSKNIAVLKKVFLNTVNMVSEHVQGDAAKYFTDLIRLMRSSDSDTLIELSILPHSNKILARKVYLDALFRVGTSNSVKAIVRQMSNMSENEKRLAYLSFNLVQFVEKDALNQAANLLNANSPKEAFLAVGNLVNKFCKQGTCDQSEVQIVSKKFADSLRHCKANTRKEEERFVNILKGIRNTRKIADASTQVLIECALSERPLRLRVAAIQAFSAAACDSGLQKKALSILKDRNEDSEVRIEAYLSVIACPNAELANELAEIVNSETVYQVGGFIASSLRAIRDSTDPTKETLRHYLSNIRLTKQFPINPRRYSFNNELSYAIDALGVSSSVDYSIIYSQKGYLPRSARLNLTSEIFGTNYNIIEVSARQENLEEILAYYLGPKGYLNTEGRNLVGNIAKLRSKRSIADDTEKFAKKYRTYGSTPPADINLDLVIRVFGSEIFFLSLADDVPQTVDDVLQKLTEVVSNIKGGLKKFEHEYNCHALFLEAEYSYPTGIGLPLELVAQGTSTSKLIMATEIDIDAIVENPHQTKYRIKFVPSIDINVNGQIRFNALVLNAGLRVSSSLQSSSGSDIAFQLVNDAKGFNLDVEFSRSNIELVSYRHNVEFVIAEQDKETKATPLKLRKKKNSPIENCFDQLHYIGMTICFTSILPDRSTDTAAVDFPLSGPVHLALRLQTEKKISFVGEYDSNPEGRSWKLKYSTPGSQAPHDTTLNLRLGTRPNMFIRASLEHPEIKLSGEAGVKNDDHEISLYSQYEVNDEKTVQKLGLKKNNDEYSPLIEIKTSKGISNEIYGYRSDGRIIRQQNGGNVRFIFDNLQVINKDGNTITVNGWADTKPFKTELTIMHGKEINEIKSHFSFENGYSVGFFVHSPGSSYTNGASIFLQLSPNSVKSVLVVAVADNSFEMNNDLDYSRDEKNIITDSKFKNSFVLKRNSKPAIQAKLNGEVSPRLMQLDIEAGNEKRKASVKLNMSKDMRTEGDYSLDVNAKLNQHYIELKTKTDVKGNRYITDNSLTTSLGTQLSARGEIGQRFTHQDIYINLEGQVLFTSKDKQGNWLLKVTGTPDKTNTEFKLTRDNADLVSVSGETTHPQDKVASGKVSIQVKDLLGAKLDYKTNKNGKGDLTGLFNFKKAQRKITLDSKFFINAPKYDIEATIGYDNDNKLIFKTENIFDKTKISTKNLLGNNNDKILIDASGSVKGDWRLNGEVDGKLSVTLPASRQLDGQFNRKVTTAKNGVAQGSMSFMLGDTLPSGPRRTVELKGALEKYNVKTKELSATTNLIMTQFGGKKLDVTQKIKYQPKGDVKIVFYDLETKGDLLNSPIDISVAVDEYSSNKAMFRVAGKYGALVSSNINVNYDRGDRARPAALHLQADIKAPETDFKTFTFTTGVEYLRPETEGGIHSIELKINEKTGEKELSFNAFAKGNKDRGSYSLSVKGSQLGEGPLSLDGDYSREVSNENQSRSQKYSFNYANGDMSVKNSLDLSYVESKSAIVHLAIDSSFDSLKSMDLVVRTEKSDKTIDINSELQLNGQKYQLETSIFTSDHKKGASVKAIFPKQTTLVSGILEIQGERKGKITLSIVDLGSLDLEYIGEAHLKALDDFYLTSQANSQKLKINKLNIDIHAQGGSSGKVVELIIKNADGTILSGSATYVVKKEKNKTVIDGQGQVQYKSKTNNANFKIVHQLYDIATDQEVGTSFTINGTFGPKNAVATLKITNKNFQAKMSVCEEKKQCTNVEIRNMVTVDPQDVTSDQNDLMILIDLRELGYPHEFELQSKSSHKGFKFYHEIESSIISNSNHKYKLIASISPQLNKVQVKLPSREIFVETEQVVPQGILGHYKTSVTFYFDRLKSPKDVTKFVASADVSGHENVAINIKGDVRFEHPAIRTLSVSGLLDANRERRSLNTEITFDVFRTPEQKITATTSIKDLSPNGMHGFNITAESTVKSPALAISYEAIGHTSLMLDREEFRAGYVVKSETHDIKLEGLIYGSKDRIECIFSVLDEQVLNAVAEFNRIKGSGKITSTLQLFSSKPLNLIADIDESSLKILLKRVGLFDASAEIKLGKEAKLVLKDGGKKILSGRVALDPAHFLTTSIENNEEDIKTFLKSLQKNIADETESAKQILQKRLEKLNQALTNQIDLSKSSSPDFSQLQNNIQANIDDILKDLENDPAIKKFLDVYRKQFETLLNFFKNLSQTIVSAYERVSGSVKELLEQMQSLLKKSFLPALDEFSTKLADLLSELHTQAVKLLADVFEQLAKTFKTFDNDLKAVNKAVYEVVKPIADSLQELFQTIAKDLDELFKDLSENWGKILTFDALKDEIKQQLTKLKAVDDILLFLKNIKDQLNNLSATNESVELTNKLYDYIEKKLRDIPLNDLEAIEGIYKALANTLYSLWKRWTDITPPTVNYLSPISLSLDLLSNLPALISFRFSMLNFMINEKASILISLLELFKPPYEFLPPFNLAGHIADGKNIITFDGRQFSFQGSCKYILAQDTVKNDFSVVATVKDGKLKMMSLIDAKNFIEISDTGAIKLNGKSAEFPVHADYLHAWRRFYTLRLKTEYGVEVTCTSDLTVCHVTIDGIYTSKTRGLLGNGNGEPFDDFATVNGEIAANYGDFVNEYGLGNCPAVKATDMLNVEHDSICSDLFGYESSLMFGYFFINRQPYRDACDQAVLASSANKEEAACKIAMTYASAANLESLPVFLPNRCLKCPGTVGQREIGDEFTVKAPTNKADLLFVVDMGASKNLIENLVTPTITDIRNQLKSRGLNDVNIAVIVFSDDQLYPALLTTGGKVNYNGKLSQVVLNGPQRPAPLDVGITYANDILQWIEKLQNKIEPQSDESAFRFALQYPFRAGAARSIIAVRSNQLGYSNVFKLLRAHLIGAITQFDAASLHLIAPVEGLSVDGVPPEKLVGFNSRIVATVQGKDAKKRPSLKFKSDMGIDFVLQNNGWVFAAQNFDSASSEEQKKAYINQVTSSIADTIFKTEIISECKCTKAYGLHAEHKCSIKSSNFVANKRPKGA